MLRGRVGVFGHIAGLREQVGAVAQRSHIEGIPGKLFLGHHVDRYMGKVEVFQRHITNVVVVRHFHIVVVALAVRPGFRPIPHLHHYILGENILAVEQALKRTLHLVHRPRPLMERREHGDQHIGVVLNVIEVKMVFVIIVGGFIGVEVLLQLSLQCTIGGLGPQHIPILGRIGAGGYRTHKTVANRRHRRNAGLEGKDQQTAGQRNNHAHGMPLDEAPRPDSQPLRGDSRFLGGLGPMLGGLPRLFRILLLDVPLLQIPGDHALIQLGVFQSRRPELIIRRGLNMPGLGLADCFCRVFPDGLFYMARTMPQNRLAHQLGAVSALGAHIFMLHLIDFPMHKAMHTAQRRPARTLHGAGTLGRFLLRQLAPGLIQLFTPLFHTELGLRRLFLPALVSELGLRDTLSRSALTRLFAHGPYPPGGSSADRKSHHAGSDQ